MASVGSKPSVAELSASPQTSKSPTEIVEGAAANERNEVAAQYLAQSGVSIYRLVLVADKQLSGSLGEMVPFPVQGLWQMVPAINTGLLALAQHHREEGGTIPWEGGPGDARSYMAKNVFGINGGFS